VKALDVDELLEQLRRAPAEVRRIGADLARRTLPDEDRKWLHLAGEAARAGGVTLDELLGRSRAASIVLARRRFWSDLRRLTGRGYIGLGKILRRDHTTIMDGIREHERGLDRGPGIVSTGRRRARRRRTG
jgi:chromosomal replication initiation ATPase DnaA